jgi:hypothetical protein
MAILWSSVFGAERLIPTRRRLDFSFISTKRDSFHGGCEGVEMKRIRSQTAGAFYRGIKVHDCAGRIIIASEVVKFHKGPCVGSCHATIRAAVLVREIDGPMPEHLRAWWTPDLWCLHSAAWWRRHWQRTGIMDIELADTLTEGWQLWLDWHRVIAPDNAAEIKALEADRGSYLGYVRVVGRRQGQVQLADPIGSLPAQYTKQPLLRSQQNK